METTLQENITELINEVQEGVTEFTLDQIKHAQNLLKVAESKLVENRDKGKTKVVIVPEYLHNMIKTRCKENGTKIGQWAEEVFKRELGV